MSPVLQLLTALIGSLGFALLFNVRGRRLVPAALGGLLTWGVYLLAGLVIAADAPRYFLASVLLTVYAEIMARVHKSPATVFLTCGTVPLIPGGSLYTTMRYAILADWSAFSRQGLATLLLALAIAIGILCTTSLWAAGNRLRRKKGGTPKTFS